MSDPGFASRRQLSWPALALLLAAVDQAVKLVVAAALPLNGQIEVTPWFNLVHTLNPGAAFSLLAQAGGWQRHFLTAVGLGASVLLLWWLWRGVRSRVETLAFTGIIGGALGNVSDRLRLGAVVDYLDLHWVQWHWPAFNLADVFVVGGAGLLIVGALVDRRHVVVRESGTSS